MESHAKEKRVQLFRRAGPWLLLGLFLFLALPPGNRLTRWASYALHVSDMREKGSLLEIHVIDVGKADAILIRSGNRAALLDAGRSDTADQVVDYLFRHHVERLDYLILSHPDSDHVGGMPQVLKELPVGAFVQAGYRWKDSVSREYADTLALMEERRCVELFPGEAVELGQARLTAVGPEMLFTDSNNSSLVLRLDCGDFSALFCGDMEDEAEESLLESGWDLDVELLKVGHHGSGTSTTEEFVQAVSPRYAAVSVGLDRNNLPKDAVLERLEAAGAEIYRTDFDGDLVFLYDGSQVKVRLEKEERAEYETVDRRPF